MAEQSNPSADGIESAELRRLLTAYRKGLISEDLFEEQLREMGHPVSGGAPREYRFRDESFATERDLLIRFLDQFRAAETFGGVVFAMWSEVATDPRVRGGLRAVREREAMHGRALATRLGELGGRPEAAVPEKTREATRERLGSPEVSDADKVQDFVRRLPDPETATAPIREVIQQIREDHETRALLEAILEDERVTVRWFHEMAEHLGVGAAAPTSRE